MIQNKRKSLPGTPLGKKQKGEAKTPKTPKIEKAPQEERSPNEENKTPSKKNKAKTNGVKVSDTPKLVQTPKVKKPKEGAQETPKAAKTPKVEVQEDSNTAKPEETKPEETPTVESTKKSPKKKKTKKSKIVDESLSNEEKLKAIAAKRKETDARTLFVRVGLPNAKDAHSELIKKFSKKLRLLEFTECVKIVSLLNLKVQKPWRLIRRH